MIALALLFSFIAGAGAGYVVAWNRAMHPGKIEEILAERGKQVVDAVKEKIS